MGRYSQSKEQKKFEEENKFETKSEDSCIKFKVTPQSLRISYGKHEILGFIDPQSFLDLSANIDFDKEAKRENNLTSLEWHIEQLKKHNPISVPMLYIDEDRGIIIGHEGRHRAKACIETGIKKMPVVIRMYDYVPFTDENGFINYPLLNDMVRGDTETIFKRVDKEQQTKLMPLPKVCKKEGDNMICNVSKEQNKELKKKLIVRITNFEPFCSDTQIEKQNE